MSEYEIIAEGKPPIHTCPVCECQFRILDKRPIPTLAGGVYMVTCPMDWCQHTFEPGIQPRVTGIVVNAPMAAADNRPTVRIGVDGPVTVEKPAPVREPVDTKQIRLWKRSREADEPVMMVNEYGIPVFGYQLPERGWWSDGKQPGREGTDYFEKSAWAQMMKEKDKQ
jgi:hypothetical protein